MKVLERIQMNADDGALATAVAQTAVMAQLDRFNVNEGRARYNVCGQLRNGTPPVLFGHPETRYAACE